MNQADHSLKLRDEENSAAHLSIMINMAQTSITQNIQLLQLEDRGTEEYEELKDEIKLLKNKVRTYRLTLENNAAKKQKVCDPFTTPIASKGQHELKMDVLFSNPIFQLNTQSEPKLKTDCSIVVAI